MRIVKVRNITKLLCEFHLKKSLSTQREGKGTNDSLHTMGGVTPNSGLGDPTGSLLLEFPGNPLDRGQF